MSADQSPLVSEFETKELEARYEEWLKAKVQASLDNPQPTIAHDQVMAKLRTMLDAKKKLRAAD